MSRTLALAAAIVLLLSSAAVADNRIALNSFTDRASGSGRVLGRYANGLDTYGINLAIPDGVRLRDVYVVRRHGRALCQAIVVYAGPRYSMVVVKSGERLHRGDRIAYAGHLEPYHPPVTLPTGPTVFVTARVDSTPLSAPSTPSFSLPSVSLPSWGAHDVATPSQSINVGFNVNTDFNTPSVNTPGFSVAGFSPNTEGSVPGFSLPSPSFQR